MLPHSDFEDYIDLSAIAQISTRGSLDEIIFLSISTTLGHIAFNGTMDNPIFDVLLEEDMQVKVRCFYSGRQFSFI